MPQLLTKNTMIFLLGFMASGKSTVGPVLAKHLTLDFIDTDKVIVDRFNITIADLITLEGEDKFRQIETAVLTESIDGPSAVIAPGGGAITREINRELMNRHGITVWLDTPFDLCLQRILADTVIRPLASNEITARKRYEERLPLYRESKIHITIDEQTTPEKISEKIKSLIGERIN